MVLAYIALASAQASADVHNIAHFATYGKDVPAYNQSVLKAVDKVQATAMDGGGYFADPKAVPAESPIGYALALFGKPLLIPPRTTSYCSGSSYTVLIEALNFIYPSQPSPLSRERLEAMRMQEPDGGRRDDFVKVFGTWNADGPGCEYALVQYTGMGERVDPKDAKPGDFMNISWKNGLGHSVVFLGWTTDSRQRKCVLFWSSQKGTNGFGDEMSPLSRIQSVVDVRLTHPEKLFTFDPVSPEIKRNVEGDPVQ